MQPLNLPKYTFKIQTWKGREMVFDPIRKKYVRLTPEEWVRLHFVQYLIQDRGFPGSLIAIESAFLYQGMSRRADVVVFNSKGKALLLVECKSPDVTVRQETFDQIARYNIVIQARYLIVSNGLVHYCYHVDPVKRAFHFLDEIPPYDGLQTIE